LLGFAPAIEKQKPILKPSHRNMSNQFESYSPLPPALQRVAWALRIGGWVCFWVQLVLTVISTLILLFAAPMAFGNRATTLPNGVTTTNSSGISGFFPIALLGLAVLGFSAYRAFGYVRLSRKLKSPDNLARPKKAETVLYVRRTLISNCIGMLITLIGAESLSGVLLGKSLVQPQGILATGGMINQYIDPLDIFIVLGNTHAIFAHFVGMIAALWLIDQIYK
jgi:amino acid transporter